MQSVDTPNRQRYRAFGITIESDLGFPELQPSDGAPDLSVSQAPAPVITDADAQKMRTYFIGDRSRFLIRVPGAMDMEVSNGAAIRYSTGDHAADTALRLFILGSGIGAALMQRGSVVIHANAIVTPGQAGAILCMGASGAGKSTLAYAMGRAGGKILSDDVCAIGPDGLVQPGIANVKLWGETANRFAIDTGALSRVRPEDAKFHVPLRGAFCNGPQPIIGAFWLRPSDVSRVAISRVGGAQRFTVLRNNVYRPEFLRPLGRETDYMEKISALAGSVPMFQVTRPKAGFAIEPLVEAILDTSQTLGDASAIPLS